MNDALAQLYQQVIVEHHKAPRNYGPLPEATHAATVDNPLCGDQVTVRLLREGDRVQAVRFEARGCALSRASASLMTEAILGSSAADALARGRALEAYLAGGGTAPTEALAVFAGVREFPSRIVCVTLPWTALAKALTVPD